MYLRAPFSYLTFQADRARIKHLSCLLRPTNWINPSLLLFLIFIISYVQAAYVRVHMYCIRKSYRRLVRRKHTLLCVRMLGACQGQSRRCLCRRKSPTYVREQVPTDCRSNQGFLLRTYVKSNYLFVYFHEKVWKSSLLSATFRCLFEASNGSISI